MKAVLMNLTQIFGQFRFRLLFACITLFLLAACNNKETTSSQTTEPLKPDKTTGAVAQQAAPAEITGEEAIVIEESEPVVEEPPAEESQERHPVTELTIPGSDVAHEEEIEKLEQKKELLQQDVQATFYFDFDKSTLTPLAEQELQALLPVLEQVPGTIHVEGYTDNRGRSNYNKALGLHRAQSVANYLEQQGISAERLKVSSSGSDNSTDNQNESDFAKSRRVELTLKSEFNGN